MTDSGDKLLTPAQLAALQASLHRGSAHASEVLASWIGKPSVVEMDSLEQMPLEEATAVLSGGEPICFCAMAIKGAISGEMILAFDDASGLELADRLMGQLPGTTTEWTEMATSATLETANILGCAYLNSLSESLSARDEQATELLPAPPKFGREFAASLMEFALMGQAIALDQVILAKTRFQIDEMPVNWTLLFIPDAESMSQLSESLLVNGQDQGGVL